jgi:hypothetical protein
MPQVGERCSGTNFIEQAVRENFAVQWSYNWGFKHWYRKHPCWPDQEEALVIAVVRDPVQWLKSLYRQPHHLPKTMKTSFETFLTHFPVTSWIREGMWGGHELAEDRDPDSMHPLGDIFDMRAKKAQVRVDLLTFTSCLKCLWRLGATTARYCCCRSHSCNTHPLGDIFEMRAKKAQVRVCLLPFSAWVGYWLCVWVTLAASYPALSHLAIAFVCGTKSLVYSFFCMRHQVIWCVP